MEPTPDPSPKSDRVQITAAETVGVEGRGSFYEATGALRDMVRSPFHAAFDGDDGAARRLRRGRYSFKEG